MFFSVFLRYLGRTCAKNFEHFITCNWSYACDAICVICWNREHIFSLMAGFSMAARTLLQLSGIFPYQSFTFLLNNIFQLTCGWSYQKNIFFVFNALTVRKCRTYILLNFIISDINYYKTQKRIFYWLKYGDLVCMFIFFLRKCSVSYRWMKKKITSKINSL